MVGWSQNYQSRIQVPDYTPNSPQAYAMGQEISYPVSLYTGIPTINIPLFEIKTGALTIPISLNYHASGIRASQEATCVGLGWNLNAIQMISRTLKCGDDFNEHGAYDIPNGYFVCPEPDGSNYSQFYGTQQGSYNFLTIGDSEPDIFFYNANGISGKFIFTKDTIPVFFNTPMGEKIKVRKRGEISFELTDKYGNAYIFDKKEITQNVSCGNLLAVNNYGNSTDIKSLSEMRLGRTSGTYTSCWLLSRICSATHDTIDYVYESEDYQLPVMSSKRKFNLISMSNVPSGYSAPLENTHTDVGSTKAIIMGQRLKEIKWRNGRVEFLYTERDDIRPWFTSNIQEPSAPKKLERMQVYSCDGNLLKSYHFLYGYYNSNSSDLNPHLYKRLRLEGIESDLESDWKYSFKYESGDLPAKNTHNTDFLGFYNGTDQGFDFYAKIAYGGEIFPGGDKAPRFEYMKRGILNKVKQPLGGDVEFIYEPNIETSIKTVTEEKKAYYWVCSYDGVYDENYSELADLNCDTFEVSNKCSVDFRMSFETTGSIGYIYADNSNSYPTFVLWKIDSSGRKECLKRYSVPTELNKETRYSTIVKEELNAGTYILEARSVYKNLYSEISASYLDYCTETKEVTEEMGGLRIKEIKGDKDVHYTYSGCVRNASQPSGYIDTKIMTLMTNPFTQTTESFLVQTSEPIQPLTTLLNDNIFGYTQVTENYADGTSKMFEYNNEPENIEENRNPFIPRNINYYNGKLINDYLYDKDGQEVMTHEYEYTYNASKNVVRGFVNMFKHQASEIYLYQPIYGLPSRTITTEKFADSELEERTEYSYNKDNQKTHEVHSNKVDSYEHVTKYANDYSGNISAEMLSRNMVGMPLEDVYLKNHKAVSGKKIEYGLYHGMVLPKSIYLLETDIPIALDSCQHHYSKEIAFNVYDAYGNPEEIEYKGRTSVWLWGYGYSYPVVKIENMKFKNVISLLGQDFIDRLNVPVPSDKDLMDMKQILSRNKCFARLYGYKPLIGVNSITNERGFRMLYEYDMPGRLSSDYYMNGTNRQLIHTYRYSYAK